jgi:hypothetical protein
MWRTSARGEATVRLPSPARAVPSRRSRWRRRRARPSTCTVMVIRSHMRAGRGLGALVGPADSLTPPRKPADQRGPAVVIPVRLVALTVPHGGMHTALGPQHV